MSITNFSSGSKRCRIRNRKITIEGLVNDPVVVRVERRLLLAVGESADVVRPAERLRPPQTLEANPVGIFAPGVQQLELRRPQCARRHDFKRQAEWKVERPKRLLRFLITSTS